MRLSSAVGFAVFTGLGAFPKARAWGAAGHEIIAVIAQIHLNPPVLPLLCSILYPNSREESCYISSVAAWADSVRYRSEFRWSAPLHYVGAVGDHPSDSCVFPGDRGWSGREGKNVLAAIRNVTGLLETFVENSVLANTEPGSQSKTTSDLGMAQEALKFLIHFIGDLHQPLHLTGRDRGGNGDKVSWDGRVTNLHSLWDGLLIAKALRSMPSPSNYSHPLPIPVIESALRGAIYDPYIRKIMWEGVGVGMYSGDQGKWEDEIEEWLECPNPSVHLQRHSRPPSFVAGSGSISTFNRLFQQAVLAFLGWSGGQNTDDGTLCPHAWAAPIHELNCDLVWPKELDEPPYNTPARAAGVSEDIGCLHASSAEEEVRAYAEHYADMGGRRGGPYLELDTPEYAGRIEKEWIVEKLLAMGGVRLAGVLNEIFAPLVDNDTKMNM
ncbi:hypothetical protein EW146_g2214 [Bondarzewia mesenterica]|uniref:Uncharacterized protein n=1 Tax=Bondarzewia mesenterica TaxID=1095465 RepID=A0A4S4M7N1_9AGAM|nr:hypothetical protein EW146_g2214 [Bondarzewia mesenterica]